jgi:hypothetical protein
MLETVGSDGSGLQYHVSILPKKVANDYHMTKEDSLWYCFGIACLLIKMVKDKAVMKTKCPFTGNCVVTSCHVLHPFVFIFHSRLSHFSQINVILTSQCTFLSFQHISLFFLEHAGELRIIILRRKNTSLSLYLSFSFSTCHGLLLPSAVHAQEEAHQ